jgi:leader peptidase (prepilin peptidase)/N-methyltransferase
MAMIYSILLFLIGLAVGSFLNVVIFRIDELSTIIRDRSHCPKCKQVLAWYDLIPFLSFVLLKARCRYCNEQISWQYPLVELGTGILYLLLFLNFGLSFALAFYLLVFSILVIIFVYDARTQTVPELFVWIALLISLIGGWLFGGFTILSAIIAAVIAGGFLGILVYFSKERWMGSGDVKMGVTLGLLTGYPGVLVALFSAFMLGSIVGIIAIILKYKSLTKKSLKLALPFAPFLIAGILVSLVFAPKIINWYLNLFITF